MFSFLQHYSLDSLLAFKSPQLFPAAKPVIVAVQLLAEVGDRHLMQQVNIDNFC